MAYVIDGKALAAEIRLDIAGQIQTLIGRIKGKPGLATVLIGDNPASAVYVRNKIRACHEIGIETKDHQMPVSTSESQLLSLLDSLGRDPKVHGILVQLPLPKHLSVSNILEAMPEDKDVDGLGIANWGRLFQARTPAELENCFIPCTPLGVLRMIKSVGINPEGKFCCVLGRSNIVGKPMAHLLTLHNATVVVGHSKTVGLDEICRTADILIAAIGKPAFVKAAMVKVGACVIDVGINRLESGQLIGDCDFENVRQRAAYLSPVPGGVGPMTIAMLLSNTLKAWKKLRGS